MLKYLRINLTNYTNTIRRKLKNMIERHNRFSFEVKQNKTIAIWQMVFKAKTILRKKENGGEFLLIVKMYYKNLLIKIWSFLYRIIKIDQWNRIKSQKKKLDLFYCNLRRRLKNNQEKTIQYNFPKVRKIEQIYEKNTVNIKSLKII